MNSIDNPQPLVVHFVELRRRLLRVVAVVLVIFIVLLPWANELYGFVSTPLRLLMPEGSTMIATAVASPFLAPFKLTFFCALMLAMPLVLGQLWGFVAPGLYKKEKRLAMGLLFSSVVLFYLGIVFCFFVVFPIVFGFFTAAGPSQVAMMTDINSYLDFVLSLFFAFGCTFEIPIATLLLIWSGATTADSLANKRPYIVVACFVFGMLLTPPDVISQSLLALPMWLLFELGLILGRLLKMQENAPSSLVES